MNKQPFYGNLFGLLFFICWLIFCSVLSVVLTFCFPSLSTADATNWVSFLAYVVPFPIGIIIYLLCSKEKAVPALNLRLPSFMSVLMAILLGFLVQPLAQVVAYCTSFVFYQLPAGSSMDMVDGAPLWLALLMMAVLPAVFEELLCRGAILGAYRFNKRWIGIIFSALFFALMHQNFQQACYAFLLGIILGYIVSYTESILLTMIIHFINNGTQVVMMKYWPQIFAAEGESVAFSWSQLALYGGLALLVLPFVIICCRKIVKDGKVAKAKRDAENAVYAAADAGQSLFGENGELVAPTPEKKTWPRFGAMWPMYLYILIGAGICVAIEFFGPMIYK